MPICLPLPIDHTELKGRPFVTALSRMNTAVAPEPLMKSTPLGLSWGMGLVNTEWCQRVSRPIQLGPMSAQPYFSQVSRICCSSKAPSWVSSPKPAEMMMKARTCFSAARYSTY